MPPQEEEEEVPTAPPSPTSPRARASAEDVFGAQHEDATAGNGATVTVTSVTQSSRECVQPLSSESESAVRRALLVTAAASVYTIKKKNTSDLGGVII